MAHLFDPGYAHEPFAPLCAEYPNASVYPAADFRVEWGPIFHRGRLDGTARVLVIGQDPGAHEAIVRRILVGEAGQRIQGFLARLGIESSYVMVNTFLYSVYGQGGGERHRDDPAIAAYRHRWLDALLVGTGVEVLVALGRLADDAVQKWRATPAGQQAPVAYAHITHPTQPESASRGDPERYAAAMRTMLAGWNQALQALAPALHHPDVPRELRLYGQALAPDDVAPIPERDLPAGLPAWMRAPAAWVARKGKTAELKRATLVVTVPSAERPWTG
jgi:uracil-DNA glycosylase